jgi:hypothetical protein
MEYSTILDLGIRYRLVVRFMSRPLYLDQNRINSTETSWIPESIQCCGEEKKLVLTVIRTPILQYVARYNTDRAVPALTFSNAEVI